MDNSTAQTKNAAGIIGRLDRLPKASII